MPQPSAQNRLRDAGPSVQREHVVDWFHQNYEDPANSLPLDDEHETGFAWIYGGPHDAREVIQEEFDGVVPEEVLEDAIGEIEAEGTWWVSRAEQEEADREASAEAQFLDAVRSNNRPLETLTRALRDVDRLVQAHDDAYVRQLTLVGVVAALEAFFLDFFVSRVMADEKLLRHFVETDRDFGTRKFELRELFQRSENIQKEVTAYLADAVWHRLEHVVNAYRRTFGVQFPKEHLDTIGPAIHKRHDIVHRGGKAKDGTLTTVSKDEIAAITNAARALGNSIQQAIDDKDGGSPF